uniref:G_PROTEIN_RECEP_F1_2 domain-containing protein n=1 Tax=Steinernema glaseri TaxID=37863 RepID=A0A1I7ZAS2_9BILA
MAAFVVTSILIYIIGAFGTFGNINILIAIYRMKPRTKSSALVGLLAFGDLFCIVSEMQNATRMITGVQSYRTECFWAISPYLFMIKMQTTVMCAMAFDRLIAFTFPLRYTKIRISPYVPVCCIPGVTSGIFFLAYTAYHMDNEPIAACNPPLAYGPLVGSIWNTWSVAINILTFALSVTALISMIIKTESPFILTGYPRSPNTTYPWIRAEDIPRPTETEQIVCRHAGGVFIHDLYNPHHDPKHTTFRFQSRSGCQYRNECGKWKDQDILRPETLYARQRVVQQWETYTYKAPVYVYKQQARRGLYSQYR